MRPVLRTVVLMMTFAVAVQFHTPAFAQGTGVVPDSKPPGD